MAETEPEKVAEPEPEPEPEEKEKEKASKPKPRRVTVYPGGGATLPGVTARPTLVDHETAERLVASRAFSYDKPDDYDGGDADEFDESERPALDFWVSPVKHGDHYKTPSSER